MILHEEPIVIHPVKISRRFYGTRRSCPCLKNPQSVPILSQMNPFHTFTHYTSMIHFDIIVPSTPSYLRCSSLQILSPRPPQEEISALCYIFGVNERLLRKSV
jgi:hypothetical protein